MTVAQALRAIQSVGTVDAAGGKLKLAFPGRMRTALQPALEVLRTNRMMALTLVAPKTTPEDREPLWQDWDEWKARALNRLFHEQGGRAKPGRITAATVRHGRLKKSPLHHPGKPLDPATGIWPMAEWGLECARGFVSDERFNRGGDRVIKRTTRTVTRKYLSVTHNRSYQAYVKQRIGGVVADLKNQPKGELP
jgi:hypothetical protein